MKRKRSVSETRPGRLQELLSFVDHLSPTVSVDSESMTLIAVQLETESSVIETFGAHKLPTGMASVRRSVERYASDIHDITLVVSTMLVPRTAYTITMDDGTIVQCTADELANHLVCVPRECVLRPGNLIRVVKQNDFDGVVNAIMDGVNVNSRGSPGTESALATAATSVDDRILRYLLDLPDIDIEDTDADGNSILHRTLRRMSGKALTEFACRGAGMYSQDRRGRSILHIAMAFIRVDLCHIEVILKYAPILTLHIDRYGLLSTEHLTLDVSHNAARNRAAELIRPTKEKMIRQVAEAIGCVVSVCALGRLILDYYTVSDRKEHDHTPIPAPE
jgi:hypothetical protein